MKSIKLRKWINVHDLELGKRLLNVTPKKSNNNKGKLGLPELNCFDTMKKVKTHRMEKIANL